MTVQSLFLYDSRPSLSEPSPRCRRAWRSWARSSSSPAGRKPPLPPSFGASHIHPRAGVTTSCRGTHVHPGAGLGHLGFHRTSHHEGRTGCPNAGVRDNDNSPSSDLAGAGACGATPPPPPGAVKLARHFCWALHGTRGGYLSPPASPACLSPPVYYLVLKIYTNCIACKQFARTRSLARMRSHVPVYTCFTRSTSSDPPAAGIS